MSEGSELDWLCRVERMTCLTGKGEDVENDADRYAQQVGAIAHDLRAKLRDLGDGPALDGETGGQPIDTLGGVCGRACVYLDELSADARRLARPAEAVGKADLVTKMRRADALLRGRRAERESAGLPTTAADAAGPAAYEMAAEDLYSVAALIGFDLVVLAQVVIDHPNHFVFDGVEPS